MKNKEQKDKQKNNGKNFIAKNRIIVGIAMLVSAIVLGIFILPAVSNRNNTYTIYTLNKAINSGTTISVDMLTATQTSDKKLAESAVTEKAAKVLGEYSAKYDLDKGTYLLWNQIAKTDKTGSTDLVPAGKQIISVPVTSIYTTVSYKVTKGDIIRFYSTYNDEKGNLVAYIPSNLCFVEIYDVYDSSGVSCKTSGGAPSSISIVATEAQALDIVTLINTSKVYFSLISSGDLDKATKYLAYQTKILNGEVNYDNKAVDLSQIDVSGSVNNNASEEPTTKAPKTSN